MFTNEALHHIIFCARKEKNLDQAQLAEVIGVSQATYSRIEKGAKSLSVYQWSRLSRTLNLPIEAINYHFLDRKEIAEIRSTSIENGFTLPQAYIKRRCLKVRFLLPLIMYLNSEKNEKEMIDFFERLQMSPSFFYNLDNQINLKFLDDFFAEILKTQDIAHILKYFLNKFCLPESHGLLYGDYLEAKNLIQLVKVGTENLNRYQNLFIYKLLEYSENELTLKVSKNNFLQKSFEAAQPSTVYFLNHYKTDVLKSIPYLNPHLLHNNQIKHDIADETQEHSIHRLRVS